MAIFDHVRVRADVLDPAYDEYQAPMLSYVLPEMRGPRIFSDSSEFFERTLVTSNMLLLLDGVTSALVGGGHVVFPLYSFYGGGKTHAMMTIYHAMRDPQAFLAASRESAKLVSAGGGGTEYSVLANSIYRKLNELSGVEVIIIDGKTDAYFPQPRRPREVDGVRVSTLWGYIAAKLGRYDYVREDDAAITSPSVDTLVRVFEGRRVLLLVDEYFEKVYTYYHTHDSVLSNYARQLITFIDNLLSAATTASVSGDTSVAVVLSIPAEKAPGGEVRVEAKYLGTIVGEAIMRAHNRVAPLAIEPVEPEDVWMVVKRRLFEHVDGEHAGFIRREFRRYYEDYSDVFGQVPEKLIESIELYYPFHPAYFEVLRLVIEHNPNLMRTRDALKISRVIVRSLYRKYREEGVSEEVIMPWHIDPTNRELIDILSGFDNYRIVVDTDISKRTGEFGERKNLARMIAIAIFLRTYTLAATNMLNEVRRYFPTRETIALDVFEVGFFNANNLIPADISDTLQELPRRLYYLWVDEGRYWFWHIPNFNEIIESRARNLAASKRQVLLEELAESSDYLRGLTSRRLTRSSGERGYRLGEEYKPKLFEKVIVRKDVGLDDVPDDSNYKLVIAWMPRGASFEDIVMYSFKGGGKHPRLYKNTVVVLAPIEGLEDEAVALYARIKAIDELITNIGRSSQGYRFAGVPRQVQRALFRAQRQILQDLKDRAVDLLLEKLLNGFSIIYYPARRGVAREDVARISIVAKNLAEKAESTLSALEKAVIDVGEDYISFFENTVLSTTGLEDFQQVSLVDSEFRTKPDSIMVPKKLLLDSLREAYRKRLVMIRDSNGNLHYPGLIIGGPCDSPPNYNVTIGDFDQVISTRSAKAVEALYNAIRSMVGEERLPDGSVKIREPLIVYGDIELGLEQFYEEALENPEILTDDALKICIVERIKKPGIRVEVNKKSLEIRRGETGAIKLTVKPVGDLDVRRVKIRVNGCDGLDVEKREYVLEIGGSGGEAVVRVAGESPGQCELVITAIPIEPPGDEDSVRVLVNVSSKIRLVACDEAKSRNYTVRRISLSGPFDKMRDFLIQLASTVPEAKATGRMSHEETGLSLVIGKETQLDVVEAIIEDLSTQLNNYLKVSTQPNITVDVSLPEPISSSKIAPMLSFLLPGVDCEMEVEVSE